MDLNNQQCRVCWTQLTTQKLRLLDTGLQPLLCPFTNQGRAVPAKQYYVHRKAVGIRHLPHDTTRQLHAPTTWLVACAFQRQEPTTHYDRLGYQAVESTGTNLSTPAMSHGCPFSLPVYTKHSSITAHAYSLRSRTLPPCMPPAHLRARYVTRHGLMKNISTGAREYHPCGPGKGPSCMRRQWGHRTKALGIPDGLHVNVAASAGSLIGVHAPNTTQDT